MPPTHTPSPTPTPTATPIPPLPTIPPWSPFQPDSEQGWCWQTELGLIVSLNDVFFIDAQTGWAVGDHGTILHTEDGGSTWQYQACPVDAALEQVVFFDDRTGWIVGHDWGDPGALLYTEDGGHTWTQRSSPTRDADYIDIAWANENVGWLLSEDQVFHTVDGGQTWQQQTLAIDSRAANRITCIDEQHAWVATRDTIARTTDGGTTWTELADTPGVEAIAFVDPQTGWLVDHDTIDHTTDGGQTWHTQQQGNWFRDIMFLDARTGWAVDSKSLWSTIDGGVTWERRDAPPGRKAIAMIDPSRGWVTGDFYLEWTSAQSDDIPGRRRTIAHTRDGGETWQFQDTHIEMPSLFYTSAAHLSSFLIQKNAPQEALLARLLPSPCYYDYLRFDLHNLGWTGTTWEDVPASTETVPDSTDLQRLDIDLDQDGIDEVVLYLANGLWDLFIGILDWDGTQWQVSWFQHVKSAYNGHIRPRTTRIGVDGKQELVVGIFRLPLEARPRYVREETLLQCDHLHCHSIWSKNLTDQYSRRTAQDCRETVHSIGTHRFVELEGEIRPAIELQDRGWTTRELCESAVPSDTPEIQVSPVIETIYRWNGQVYTQNAQVELKPSYVLNADPVTKTIDLDGDGVLEQVVRRWDIIPDPWTPPEQSLSIYQRNEQGEMEHVQDLTAPFTGSPAEGILLQDTDGDGRTEILYCTTSSLSDFYMDHDDDWPTLEISCTAYRWNPDERLFMPDPTGG
jgi:photosystem II stability/assembly factor-like uncharacterized protein